MTAPIIVDCLLEAVSRESIQFYAKQYSLPEDQVEEISSYDPTSGKYLNWILRMLQAKHLRFPEDGPKLFERLSQFQKLSKKPAFTGKKDLNKYASYGELAKTIEANLEVKTKGETRRSAEMEGCKFLKQEGDEAVYLITTPEAAAKLLRHTDWCIKDPKYFAKYDPKEFYYVEKNGQPYILCHLESAQIKDKYDDDMYDPVPILEPYIATSANASWGYVYEVINGSKQSGIRWPPGEAAILKDPYFSYMYASDIIGGAWPEGEETISQDAGYSVLYAELLGHRFPAGEPAILKNSWSIVDYARTVIKGPWPEGEEAVKINSDAAKSYLEFFASQDPLYPTLTKLDDFIHRAFRRNDVCGTLHLEEGEEVGPFDGGCFIVAQALKAIFPGSEFCFIYSVIDHGDKLVTAVQHYGIVTSNGIFADGGGAYQSSEQWKLAFADKERFFSTSLFVSRGIATRNDEVPRNQEASANLAKILKKLWEDQANIAATTD